MHAKLLQLCLTVCNLMNCSQTGSSVHEDSPGRNTGVGCHNFLQRIPNTGMEPTSLMYLALKDEFFVFYHQCHLGSPKVKFKLLSHVGLFCDPKIIACQSPLSMEFPRQEYWSG